VKDEPSVIQENYSKGRTIERTINQNSIKLPKNLQSLYIDGDSYKGQFGKSRTLFSNKEENMLQNLKILSIIYFDGFSRLGLLPPSLTQLTICSGRKMKSLNSDFFDNLKSVTSLQSLTIYCPLGACFDYELPPKLEYLELSNRQLCKISLRSKSLKRFYLYQTKFSVVSPENFQVPESLVELVLSNCVITLFDDSFVFPQRLQSLYLDGQDAQKIPKLPPNLKCLFILYDLREVTEAYFPDFPSTLEELNLSSNINYQPHLTITDISYLVKLKKLSIINSKITEPVNLNKFPKSLTDLSICKSRVRKFTGTFADFPKLVNLNLSDNSLGNWLSSMPVEFSFGPAIQQIGLMQNLLDSETVINLLYNLKQSPNFGELFVENMPVPENL
ncbi:hypothetical protein G210_5924, partial [Candida maltosa Xu316]